DGAVNRGDRLSLLALSVNRSCPCSQGPAPIRTVRTYLVHAFASLHFVCKCLAVGPFFKMVKSTRTSVPFVDVRACPACIQPTPHEDPFWYLVRLVLPKKGGCLARPISDHTQS